MLEDYEGIIIAEGLQFEFNLEVNNNRELKELLKLLNNTVSFSRLNYYGRIIKQNNIPEKNPNAIYGAWDIPLVTVSGNFKSTGFLTCKEITIVVDKFQASMLTRNKRKELKN